MNVAVAMPWRSTPARRPAHRRIHQFWRHANIDVIEADSTPHKAFNLCAARNAAVKAIGTLTPHTDDIVIVADADTLPDLGAIHTAIQTLQAWPTRSNIVIWPYQTYRHISSEYVDEPDLLSAPTDRIYHNSVGGLFITHRATYWQLGGMDERFRGWGFDDNAFALVAQTLGTMTRTPGTVFSFNHPARRDTSNNNPNKKLYQSYVAANGNPRAMQALITP